MVIANFTGRLLRLHAETAQSQQRLSIREHLTRNLMLRVDAVHHCIFTDITASIDHCCSVGATTGKSPRQVLLHQWRTLWTRFLTTAASGTVCRMAVRDVRLINHAKSAERDGGSAFVTSATNTPL